MDFLYRNDINNIVHGLCPRYISAENIQDIRSKLAADQKTNQTEGAGTRRVQAKQKMYFMSKCLSKQRKSRDCTASHWIIKKTHANINFAVCPVLEMSVGN